MQCSSSSPAALSPGTVHSQDPLTKLPGLLGHPDITCLSPLSTRTTNTVREGCMPSRPKGSCEMTCSTTNAEAVPNPNPFPRARLLHSADPGLSQGLRPVGHKCSTCENALFAHLLTLCSFPTLRHDAFLILIAQFLKLK